MPACQQCADHRSRQGSTLANRGEVSVRQTIPIAGRGNRDQVSVRLAIPNATSGAGAGGTLPAWKTKPVAHSAGRLATSWRRAGVRPRADCQKSGSAGSALELAWSRSGPSAESARRDRLDRRPRGKPALRGSWARSSSGRRSRWTEDRSSGRRSAQPGPSWSSRSTFPCATLPPVAASG